MGDPVLHHWPNSIQSPTINGSQPLTSDTSCTIHYTRKQLLSLRSGSNASLPHHVYTSIKNLGIFRNRSRRAGTHMRRKNVTTDLNLHNQELSSSSSVTITPPALSLTDSLSSSRTDIGASINICHWNARSIRNKTITCSDYTLEHDVDVMFLTETWLTTTDNVVIAELTLPGYNFLTIPRGSCNFGGGLGVLYKVALKLQLLSSDFCSSTFEHAIISDKQNKVMYVLIYRPYPSPTNGLKTSEFLKEFDVFLTHINCYGTKTIMLGDFNIHVNTPEKSDAKHFMSSFDEAGFCQHIIGPTHISGNTLDLILSHPEDRLVMSTSVGVRLSDHNVTHCTLNLQKPETTNETRSFRNFRKIDHASFHSDLAQSFNSNMTSSNDVNELTVLYNDTVTNCLNKHAPITSRKCNARKRQPWYNEDIHVARRRRRKLEKKWRKTKSEVYHQQYIEQNKLVNSKINESKQTYYREQFDNADIKSTFRIVNSLLDNDKKILPNHDSEKKLACDFASFFTDKVSNIHSKLKREQCKVDSRSKSSVDSTVKSNVSSTPKNDSYDQSVSCKLSRFKALSEEDVVDLVSNSNAKSCLLDSLPTWYLKQHTSVFIPALTHVINMSLSTGIFPNILKHAIINPIIKKQSLDPNDLKNYRPVANIPFLSKLIEKHVFRCINEHMEEHNLGEELQSAYRSAHSTETALLQVKTDIMSCLYNQQGVFLVLLDLSSAFDTVEHSVLVRRMANEIGLSGTALTWYKSYFAERSSKVCINGTFSDSQDMNYGLPQGSIVGPGSFKIYTIPIGRIIRKHQMSFHMYADDIQLYTSFNPADTSSIQIALSRLATCISEIKLWMTMNMLMLNDTKTEFLLPCREIISSRCLQFTLILELISSILPILYGIWAFYLTRTCLCHRIYPDFVNLLLFSSNISRIRRFLDTDSCHHIVRSLVLSRLDYGNALLLGSNKTDIAKLQRLQNWAVKLIHRAGKQDHATPYMEQLHWLPIHERIVFKILLLVFKCVNNIAPPYLGSNLLNYTPSRTGLRSSADITRLVEHTIHSRKLQSAADRSFLLRCSKAMEPTSSSPSFCNISSYI
ncbi:uncharacterized protein [Amphiura filiformis]|uniref:uncharacterized protein n=1 Tax=Amphiura filiformis TaxID=82378 RepID=UPI003B20F561